MLSPSLLSPEARSATARPEVESGGAEPSGEPRQVEAGHHTGLTGPGSLLREENGPEVAFNHDSQEAASGLAAVCPSNPHLRAPLAWVLRHLLHPQQLQAGAGSPAGLALVQVLHRSCCPLGKGWCPHPPGDEPTKQD